MLLEFDSIIEYNIKFFSIKEIKIYCEPTQCNGKT